MADLPLMRIGGKGSSLSSSAVYAVANSLARVTIDSSALDRLPSSTAAAAANVKPHNLLSLLPPSPSVEESRASLVVLLAKLLSVTGIRQLLPLRIAQALNSNSSLLIGASEALDLTDEETLALANLKDSSALYGVCALLDRQSAALSTISDAVAALSCEALRADVAGFSSVDAGDGFGLKEEKGVANDMKVLLNGSKLVGKVEIGAVSEILNIHGGLRTEVKSLHAVTRARLNSGGSQSAESERKALLGLAMALFDLGSSSLRRARLDLEAVGSERLVEWFGKQCTSSDERLRGGTKLVMELAIGDEKSYAKFAHRVNVVMELVWKIVSLEATVAFVALEGGELSGEEKGQENAKAGKKKKKVVLGKGTSVMVQLIRDRLQGVGGGNATDGSELLENGVKELFLDPNSSDFDGLLNKVKEIVESNESRRLPKLPKGTRDFAKEQMTIRKKAFSIIEEVFEKHGATALDTPVFELRDTLMGKYGEDSKLIYDLADQGGELSSLRYDLTVPFARYVAMNGITSFKRYQIAKVYRRDNPSKGRYREFYQCDFDIAGQSDNMVSDFEAVYVLTELLDALNIGEYEVKLNHRKLLDGMLEICGVPPEKFRTICSSIDKLDKQSFEQIKKEMVEEKGLTVETADKIGTFVKERGHPLQLLSKLKQEGSKFLENSSSKDALDDLQILFECLESSQCIGKVVFDLSLARGLDYYTGVIYEAVFKGGAQMGSIAAGGRYDNLIGMFGTKQVPAVGVSLGIERVFAIMEQTHKDQNQTTRATKTEVLVSILWDNCRLAAELSGELWKANVPAEFLINKRMTKHFDRAKDSKIPWMIIVNEKEQNEGVVRLRDTAAGKDVVIQRSDIVQELKRRLDA
ncbi:histidine--tRNA ligase, cytoplasmic [Argentina anserina]|uniref:histidine--tRNA ligase, cytoplasmic n=1 Tax=Argentina anserina TaxID=57926 RepID=UPI0021766584|nr:histidine--tRNA ligase, cytoplasmic [Potentilla anserina]